jgi:uncharacterized protein YbjT (DUF2867 family)
MILVAGGTGGLGTRVVESLLAAGAQVRVLTRDADRARHLPPGADVCVGDIRDPAVAARAVRGAATVISAIQGFAGTDPDGPAAVDHRGNSNLITAAGAAGAGHFILISIHGAAAGHSLGLWRAKYQAEQELRASGVDWTIIRPTAFMETWISTLAAPIRRGGKAVVFGRGDNPVNFVSVADVAAMVVAACAEPGLRGVVAEIGGPENVSLTEFCRMLMNILSLSGPVRHVPRPVMRLSALLLRPIRPDLARLVQAGVLMDTADMTLGGVSAQPDGVTRTRLADAARRMLLTQHAAV